MPRVGVVGILAAATLAAAAAENGCRNRLLFLCSKTPNALKSCSDAGSGACSGVRFQGHGVGGVLALAVPAAGDGLAI